MPPVFVPVEVAEQDDGRLYMRVKFWRSQADADAARPPVAVEAFHTDVVTKPSTRQQVVKHPNGRWYKRLDGGWDQPWVEVDGEWQIRQADPAVHEFETITETPRPILDQALDPVDLWLDHIIANPYVHIPQDVPRSTNRGLARRPELRALVGKQRRKGER